VRGKRFISPPKLPDWLWSLLMFLFNWHQDVRMTTRLHPVQRLRNSGNIPPVLLYVFIACTEPVLNLYVTSKFVFYGTSKILKTLKSAN
jgi:hypothetical protein